MNQAAEEAGRFFRLACRDRDTFVLLSGLAQADEAAIGFHAQQAIEKALKAVLFLFGVEFRRTHDLEELASMLQDIGHKLPVQIESLRYINPYAVEFRYQEGELGGLGRDALLPIVTAVTQWCETCLAGTQTSKD